MDSAILAWARAQASTSDAATLARAYVSGVVTVVFADGRRVEYRSLSDIGAALATLYGAENVSSRRPAVTYARVSRGW